MESEESDNELDAERARLEANVGDAVRLEGWSGISVGHDASWKGSKVTRCVVIQAGGVGTDRYTWGNWWGRALEDLGADVAAVVETRISGAGNHAAACRGVAWRMRVSPVFRTMWSRARLDILPSLATCEVWGWRWQCDKT